MVELQSCGSMVNASACSGIEEQVNGDGVNTVLVAEISADLQRERQKNAQLMDRISLLEAQLQNKSHDSYARERRFKKFKRQKMEPSGEEIEEGNIEVALNSNIVPAKDANLGNCLVNWMSMDDNQFFNFEKVKAGKSTADCYDTNDSDDENLKENHINIVQKERGDNLQAPNAIKYLLLGGVDTGEDKPTLSHLSEGSNKDLIKYRSTHDINPVYNMTEELKTPDRKENMNFGEYNELPKILTSPQELRGFGSVSMQKKPPKMAFCPKEVKRIMELEELLLKNAQSHTIRKIIVFASLGIRHGCEDMYELDFNHFTILHKGEPYVSPKSPGEHVLYEKPGVRRKVFYSNGQNPTLCPVQILEEEKAMRPPDSSCPSCLFLCIKYGGRTRNLPQNEYVRQRMGRNKLKSFGPVICRMAMLVHIRTGSFFFKAFGITLLFMAGFPDDFVQRETKYRNLDLLQKYYRTDEDAEGEGEGEGEELFLSCPMACDTHTIPNPQRLTGKTISTKSKARKNTSSIIKSDNFHKASILQPAPSSCETPTTVQFGLTGYASHQLTPANPQYCTSQSSYPIIPTHQANSFVPMMYFAPPICPYPSSYAFQYFPSAANYIPIQPQLYYGNPLIPKLVQGTANNNAVSDESDSDSNTDTESNEE